MLAPSVIGLMPRGLAHLGPEAEMPSSSIYVSEPLRDLLVPAPAQNLTWTPAPVFTTGRPIRALTPNAFHARGRDGNNAIVVRSWSAAARRRVERLRKPQLNYVIDDDVEAGIDEPSLPAGYRRRLRMLLDGPYEEIVNRADRVLVPSARLAERMSKRVGAERVEIIAPSLLAKPSSLDHHEAETTQLLFANTRSHLVDWLSIWPEVRDFLADNEDVELTTYLHRDGGLQELANVDHRRSEPWADFRPHLTEQRFHIALLPGLKTDFNAARSHNKLLECAVWGVVPVVSRHLPYAKLVEEAGAGIVCSDRDGEWRDALEALRDSGLRRRLAQANVELALQIGDPGAMRTRWESILGL